VAVLPVSGNVEIVSSYPVPSRASFIQHPNADSTIEAASVTAE